MKKVFLPIAKLDSISLNDCSPTMIYAMLLHNMPGIAILKCDERMYTSWYFTSLAPQAKRYYTAEAFKDTITNAILDGRDIYAFKNFNEFSKWIADRY